MSTKAKLEGRRALVTGGGRGIGRAIALALAGAGADVAVAARTRDQTGRVAAEIEALGRRGIGLTADVTLSTEVERMAAEAVLRLGPIDILVNSAGGAVSAPASRTDRKSWDGMLAVNLTSVFLCTSQFLPGMLERGWGRVINVASSAGLQGYAYVSAYCAAKHGVVGFTRAVAIELVGKGVTMNALCPGYADTEMTRDSARRIAASTGMSQEETLSRLARFNPSGRLIQPEEVATAALGLVSSEAAAINGGAFAL